MKKVLYLPQLTIQTADLIECGQYLIPEFLLPRRKAGTSMLSPVSQYVVLVQRPDEVDESYLL